MATTKQTAAKAAPAAQQADAFAGTTAPAAAALMPAEVAAQPTVLEKITSSRTLVAKANAVVVTAQTYPDAVEALRDLRGAFRELEEERLGITRAMDAAKAKVMAFFSPATDAIEEAGKILKGKVNAYDADQQRIADEARLKAEQEAREARERLARAAALERQQAEERARAQREEADRQRAEQEAQQRREREAREAQEREQQRQRDAAAAVLRAQQQAEAARIRGDQEAAERARAAEQRAQRESDEAKAREAAAELQRQQAATAAADAGKAATQSESKAATIETRAETKAAGLEMQATSVVANVVESGVQQVGGVARRTVWKYEILDASKLARVALMPDDKKIAGMVKAMRKDAAAVLGEGAVRIWEENDIAVRAAK